MKHSLVKSSIEQFSTVQVQILNCIICAVKFSVMRSSAVEPCKVQLSGTRLGRVYRGLVKLSGAWFRKENKKIWKDSISFHIYQVQLGQVRSSPV